MMNLETEKELTSERVLFDENDENGMTIQNHYIPPEIWSRIFIHCTDRITLLACQLVCKRWNDLIRSYIWRKKAEIVNKTILPHNLQWQDYHLMYKKQPFNRNLIKNHSGEKGSRKHWNVLESGGDGWKTECPPAGVPPLPEDPFFGPARCFVTSYDWSLKEQTVDLVQKGLPVSVLDNYKPRITVSEWYSCRWDCSAIYKNSVELLDENQKIISDMTFTDILEKDKQNVWLQFNQTFTEYKTGVRKIKFRHSGIDQNWWAGHFGSKMARACIKVESFTEISTEIKEEN